MSTNLYAPADPEHGHKHWNQPRFPGRAVRRRQQRAMGMFTPRRRYRGKGKGTRADRVWQAPVKAIAPGFVQRFPTLGRIFGGDR